MAAEVASGWTSNVDHFQVEIAQNGAVGVFKASASWVEGYLNGKLYLEHEWTAPISGRIGLWSKADSYVYFDDYAVKPAN